MTLRIGRASAASLSVFALVALTAGTVAAEEVSAADGAAVLAYVDPKLDKLLVVDRARGTATLYSLSDEEMSVLAERRLWDDPEEDGGAATAPSIDEMTDVPGEDPDGFPRPRGSVRVAAAYAASEPPLDVRQRAVYLVPGPVTEVFDAVRSELVDWEVYEWSVQAVGPERSGDLAARRGDARLSVTATAAPLADWTELRVVRVGPRGAAAPRTAARR